MAVVGSSFLLATTAAASTAVTVDVATNATFSRILTDTQGFALYFLPTDHNGISTCTGSCATVWPALTVPGGTTPTGGPGVTGTVAAVMQPNGTFQVTYDGSPLYTFVGDTAAGEVTGNNVGGFKVQHVSACPGTATQCITSGASATVTAASSLSVFVTTTGTPTPKITAKGALPKGVKFHKGFGTAAIAGVPTSTRSKSAVGTYALTITATFGKGKTKNVVTQAFTLTVT